MIGFEVTPRLEVDPMPPETMERLIAARRAGERLRATYATAMMRRHDSPGRVEIHVSAEMPTLLREWAQIPEIPSLSTSPSTLWGFPIVVDERLPEDSIQVHCVESIH